MYTANQTDFPVLLFGLKMVGVMTRLPIWMCGMPFSSVTIGPT
ncbi:MAG: hypothetical protein WB615_06160 [Candidatus Tumulicola sp.]